MSKASKILPIPIIRTSLPNSPKLRTRFQANGYKYFSKISAAGSDTLQILKSIKRSSTLKFAPNFEFDPSLSDDCCLAQLNIVLKKLRNIKQLNLIIRRLNPDADVVDTRKVKKIGQNISKLLRLTKLRIEFSKTSNINQNQILVLHRALQKCYLLTSFEWILVESPYITNKYIKSWKKLISKLRKLVTCKDYISVQGNPPNGVFDESDFSQNLPFLPTIKNLEINYFGGKEWSNMGEDGDTSMDMLARFISNIVNLESFKMKLIRDSIFFQDILYLFQGFTSMVKIRNFDLELFNCQVSDQELMAFVYGLSSNSQLKSVRLKIIQNFSLSIESIQKFIEKVSAMENLEKFDFYFRKQCLPAREISRLQQVFSQYKDVQCSFTPQSLYLYRHRISD